MEETTPTLLLLISLFFNGVERISFFLLVIYATLAMAKRSIILGIKIATIPPVDKPPEFFLIILFVGVKTISPSFSSSKLSKILSVEFSFPVDKCNFPQISFLDYKLIYILMKYFQFFCNYNLY